MVLVIVLYTVEQTFEDEHDYALSEQPARGRKSIFECFWNGRLIPYTQIDRYVWTEKKRHDKKKTDFICKYD